MAKVTKLSIETLQEKAKSTPVFAPGLSNLALMGAVHMVWNNAVSLADQMEALLADTALRSRMAAVAARMQVTDGTARAADLIERVAVTKRPITRTP